MRYLEIFMFVRFPIKVFAGADIALKFSGSLRLSLTEKAVQPASDPPQKIIFNFYLHSGL